MDERKQAKIILDEVTNKYFIPAYLEEYVMKGIMAGLERISRTRPEQIMFEEIDRKFSIPAQMEKYVMQGIKEGLRRIEKTGGKQ